MCYCWQHGPAHSARRDDMKIRPETPGDYGAIEHVHMAAFAVHPYSRQTEHLIVNALRADHALAVSLVAEIDGKVVGHIAFSPAKIEGRECGWFILGPIGVLPDHQRRGIGRELIRAGLEALGSLAAEGCVLVGDPAYYARLGFTHNPALAMQGVPAQNLMYLSISGCIPHGCVSHHPAFLAT